MKIIGNKFRSFYPQSSLNFNFTVTNYTSNDFEIGVSGTDYINFKFKSGIIRDHYNNIIGTFNKERIDIDAYIKEPFVAGSYSTNVPIYKSYLNSKPVIRNSIIANPTSVFDSIVAKILSGPNDSLDLDFTLKAEKIPVLEFTQFHSDTTSLIGTITNRGDKYVEIFSMTSESVNGTWTYDKQLLQGVPSTFKNIIPNSFPINKKVILNLKTSFGNVSYELYVGDPQRVELSTIPVTVIPNQNYNFIPAITLVSQPLSSAGTSEAIYQIDYLLSNPSDKVDLLFEYNAGVTNQSITRTITETKDIYFSGILPCTEGKGFGTLFNDDYSIVIEDYKVAEYPDNTQDVLFSSTQELQQSFSNLNATGEVVYPVTNASDDLITISLNDVNLSSNYYMDLGGKTGISPILESQEKTYTKIDTYKELSVKSEFVEFNITGIVTDQAAGGAYYFDNVEVPIKSGVLQNTIAYPSITMGSDAETITTIYPYRGVGYATLADKSVILRAETKNSKTPFLLVDRFSSNILFKNLSNIDYNGKYTLKSTDLIKAKVFNVDSFYKKEGLKFNYNSLKVTSSNLINNIISDGILAYFQLTPFENLNNLENKIYRVEAESQFLMQPDINWDDNNLAFLNVRKGVFYSDSPNLKLGLTFDANEFTLNRTLSTSKNKVSYTNHFAEVASTQPPIS
jgi:hypothetical protein